MNTKPKLTIAWATVPQSGGTYHFYQLLRRALRPYGWTVLGVSVGNETVNWNESLVDDNCVKVGSPHDSFDEAVKAFINWSIENKINIVMPVGSSIMSSAMPHMPANIKFLMQGNNITRHTYATTLVHRNCVSHYIGISKRHYDDLINRYKVPADKITLIPHALDLNDYSNVLSRGDEPLKNDHIKIAYLGRLIDKDKGIFLIPKILSKLQESNISFSMEIAGDGPDSLLLESKLKGFIKDGFVTMRGSIHPNDVPSFLVGKDIFLMPSNFEGFGFTLIEAMAAGCVPIVSSISGVTDWIVTHEQTGLLCKIGDANSFFCEIKNLYNDIQLKEKLSASARVEVSERFNVGKFSLSYDAVFNKILNDRNEVQPINISLLKLSKPYRKSWRHFIPNNIKITLRKFEEKARLKLKLLKGF